ncbi:hypothetical protein D3C85_1698650 [compost metagenome]
MRGRRFSVALSAATPQKAAGIRMEPPMSLPRSRQENPIATATALPPELPPDVRARFQGLRVGPNSGLLQCG